MCGPQTFVQSPKENAVSNQLLYHGMVDTGVMSWVSSSAATLIRTTKQCTLKYKCTLGKGPPDSSFAYRWSSRPSVCLFPGVPANASHCLMLESAHKLEFKTLPQQELRSLFSASHWPDSNDLEICCQIIGLSREPNTHVNVQGIMAQEVLKVKI